MCHQVGLNNIVWFRPNEKFKIAFLTVCVCIMLCSERVFQRFVVKQINLPPLDGYSDSLMDSYEGVTE